LSNGDWYLLDVQGKPVGPYVTGTIEAWLRDERIHPETLAWRDGMRDWAPLAVTPIADAAGVHATGSTRAPRTFTAGFTSLGALTYAHAWQRLVAYLIDLLVYLPVYCLLGFGMIVGAILSGVEIDLTNPSFTEPPPIPLGIEIASRIAEFLLWWLYHAALEASPLRGSVGKRVMGLRVTDEAGRPLGFVHALGRNVAKVLSLMTLLIGFVMIAFTDRKQGLHDMVARCVVLRTS
jgi:uncharacterized RDD family membrane protein YckC